jgi:hypothetical protein
MPPHAAYSNQISLKPQAFVLVMAGMQQVGFPLGETTKEQSISATEYNAPTDQGRSALWKSVWLPP